MKNFLLLLAILTFSFSTTAKEQVTVVHVVSKGMPLSLKSYRNLKSLEKKMSFKLIVLQDSFFPFTANELETDGIAQDHGYLSKRGAFLHFPSTLILKDKKPCGSMIPGFKSEAAFAKLISTQLDRCIGKRLSLLANKEVPTANYKIDHEVSIPDNARYFFKAFGNEGFIYHDGTKGYVNLTTQNRIIMVPGSIDHFPSPDLELIAVPNPLRLFDLNSIVSSGLTDLRGTLPILNDESIMEDYESIGVLKATQDERLYRVITASDVSGVFRDYHFDLKTRVLSPVAPRKPLCPHLQYSVPMISKTGLLFGIQNNENEFSAVIRVNHDGNECTEILNLGRPTGKIAFDYQDQNILFTAVNPDRLSVYMVNLNTKIWTEVISCSDCRYTFPDFTPSGDIVVMKTIKANNEKKIVTLKRYF